MILLPHRNRSVHSKLSNRNSSRMSEWHFSLSVPTDYSQGFGGKFGVQSDRQDKSASGWDHIEKVEKHESQKGRFCCHPVHWLAVCCKRKKHIHCRLQTTIFSLLFFLLLLFLFGVFCFYFFVCVC